MKIDIFTDRYEYVGIEEKAVAIANGYWHRVFSCLVLNASTRTVFLQKRYPGQYEFNPPNYADITVGGHYAAGEKIEEGIRELHEELGLRDVKYSDLIPIGIRQTCVTLAPDYIEREFQHIHLFPMDRVLEEFPLDGTEVAEIIEIGLEDAMNLAIGSCDNILAASARRQGPDVVVQEGVLQRTDLVPGYLAIDELYLRLFLAAKRYCDGERALLYW